MTYVRDDGYRRGPNPHWPDREYQMLEGAGLCSTFCRRSATLAPIAERAWPHATVQWGRGNEGDDPLRPEGYHYQLVLGPITERPPIYLGASKEEAEANLHELVEAADVDQVARKLAAEIKAMNPGEKRRLGGARVDGRIGCTRKGRVQFAVRDEKLRERILDALGDGWTYTKHGAWWNPPGY